MIFQKIMYRDRIQERTGKMLKAFFQYVLALPREHTLTTSKQLIAARFRQTMIKHLAEE